MPFDNRSGPAALTRPGPGTGGRSSHAPRILRPVGMTSSRGQRGTLEQLPDGRWRARYRENGRGREAAAADVPDTP